MRTELTLVAREVDPLGVNPARFVEVGPLVGASSLSYTETLEDDGTLTCAILPAVQQPEIRAGLRTLSDPYEVWLRIDGTLVWAGPIVGWQGSQGLARIQAAGLGHYLRGLILGSSRSHFTGQSFDQTGAIRVALTEIFARAGGRAYGLTTTIANSGVTRDPLELESIDVIAEVARNLADLDGGFDFLVTADRKVRCAYPSFGSDLSAEVIFDRRNVVDENWLVAAGLEDLVSDVWVVGENDDDGTPKRGHFTNTTVLEEWGERAITLPTQGIKSQAGLNAAAKRGARARNKASVALAPVLLSGDIDLLSIGLGDIVTFVVDIGFGPLTTEQRILGHTTSIDDAGRVSMRVQTEPAV